MADEAAFEALSSAVGDDPSCAEAFESLGIAWEALAAGRDPFNFWLERCDKDFEFRERQRARSPEIVNVCEGAGWYREVRERELKAIGTRRAEK